MLQKFLLKKLKRNRYISFLFKVTILLFCIICTGYVTILKSRPLFYRNVSKYLLQFKDVKFLYEIKTTTTADCSNKMLLIVIPSRPSDFERRMEIRNSWLKNIVRFFALSKGYLTAHIDVTYRFFVGFNDDKNVREKCFAESQTFKDLVITNVYDSYKTLEYKTFVMLNWQQVFCSNAKYILKIDDDALVFIPRLLYWIENDFEKEYRETQGKIIFGNLLPAGKIDTDFVLKWNNQHGVEYCQGFTYLMSTKAAKILLSITPRENFERGEDLLFTGLLAERAGIIRSHKPTHFTKAPIKGDCGCDKNGVPYITSVFVHWKTKTVLHFPTLYRRLSNISCLESRNITREQYFASCVANTYP